ncbi:MAG TPA: class I SAM-dependent methyltransferase [Bacteroidales bacterium]|nr:class I SAM-dependent methyltransferase [Bacteroidales bacterium]
MKIPGNISYFFKIKQNNKLPDYLNKSILNNKEVPESYHIAKDYRQSLIKSDKKITTTDFGAGSKKIRTRERKISKIASVCGTNEKYGLLFHKIVKHFQSSVLLELGTSVGIGTMCFASASKQLNITTIEACEHTCDFAKNNIKSTANIYNINFINNDFDTVLDSGFIKDKYDLVFIDGNHKGEILIKYYQQIVKSYTKSQFIIILDDINWSRDMYSTWEQITKLDKSKTYLNLYRTGLIISGYDTVPGHFTINFVNNRFCSR